MEKEKQAPLPGKAESMQTVSFRISESVYFRLIDVCTGKGMSAAEWLTDKINREWINRSRILRRDYEKSDSEYLARHKPKCRKKVTSQGE